ncbi:MAG TPA: phage BR0599 family protein, partial [Sphingomonas sp.]
VAMAGRRRFVRVVAIDDVAVTLDGEEPVEDAYGGGSLRWFGGSNAGLIDAIASSAGAIVVLEEAPRFAAQPGVLVELIEGCDKRLSTCAGRFANAVNFRGEPFLPGIDLLTRYPGA